MNTIDIFLASSNELAPERNFISYLAVLIDEALCRRGIQLRIQKWEHFDAAMNVERKQTEYNAHLREAEMVMVLFWNKLGKYTREEYDEAAKLVADDSSRSLSLFFKASNEARVELRIFRQEVEATSPQLVNSFSCEDELALRFLLVLNQYIATRYGKSFLRKVVEADKTWLYADDIKLCPYSENAGDIPYGKNLSNQPPEDDGLKPLTMFLACTPDQNPLRNDFCDLLLAWNKMLAIRGRKIRLRFFDRSRMNEFIKNSEIAIAFYWRDFGSFDQAALDEARTHLAAKENPRKIYMFFRNDDSEILSQEFKAFKESLSADDKYAHFYIGYVDSNELRWKFLQQLELYMGGQESLLETRDGKVVNKVTGESMVVMGNLLALKNNQIYQELYSDIESLEKRWEQKKANIAEKQKIIDELTLLGDLDESKQKYLKYLQKDLASAKTEELECRFKLEEKHKKAKEMEQTFLKASMQITRLLQENHSKQLKRAIDLFEHVDSQGARALLNDIVGNVHYGKVMHNIPLQTGTYSNRNAIDALLVLVNVDGNDFSQDSAWRVETVRKHYEDALRLAQETYYPEEELLDKILQPYTEWLYKQNIFDRGELIASKMLKTCQILCVRNEEQYQSKLAKAFYWVAKIQISKHDYKEAESNCIKSIEICRKLAVKNSEAFLPDVAASLDNLGSLQHDCKRYNEAEKSYREALEIYRELASKQPEAFLPDVAASLNSLGILQNDCKRYNEAEKSYWEALKIYRGLAARQPKAFLSSIAALLNNLGILQSACQRYDEAEKSYREALEIRRELASRQPEVFLPDVATSLNNLGILQSACKRYNDAEKSYKEALEISRELASRQPETFMPDVADSLNNLGNLQRGYKRYDEAEKSYREALDIYRSLVSRQPEAFMPDMAMSLNNLGILQSACRRYDETEKSYREALAIYRVLAARQPEAFMPDVAALLNNLGILQRSCQRYDEAEKSYREALEIRRKLASRQPKVFQSSVAATLNNLGNLQRGCQRYDEAEKSYREALEIYRELASKQSEAFLPDVAASLNNLGILQCGFQRYADAEKSYREALEIRRVLASKHPEAFMPDVAVSLNNLGILQRDCKRYSEAERNIQEAIGIYRVLAQKNPNTYTSKLANVLDRLGTIMQECGKYADAEKGFLKSIELYKTLMKTQPAGNKVALLRTMKHLKEVYVQMGREKDAQRIDNEIHSIDAQGK